MKLKLTEAASRWWASLTPGERMLVLRWLRQNPPPPEWRGGKIDYAHTEMSVGIFTGRPGRVL